MQETHKSLTLKVLYDYEQLVGFIAYSRLGSQGIGIFWQSTKNLESVAMQNIYWNMQLQDLQQNGAQEIYGETRASNVGALEFYRKTLQKQKEFSYNEKTILVSNPKITDVIRIELRKNR